MGLGVESFPRLSRTYTSCNLRPMPSLSLKPTHKAVTAYSDSLAKFAKLGVKHETAVRSAFQSLLEHCARQFDWKLVPEYALKRKGQADAKADGARLDNYGLNHGLWEAKDSADDLDKEIKHKFSIGYPKQNILFWQPDRAVLCHRPHWRDWHCLFRQQQQFRHRKNF